jgi:hypothetical protein
MPNYRWRPIEPLSDRERDIDLAAIHPLYDSWRAARDRLRESSAESLNEFYGRLVRRLSIETGILERIYDLDRGTTEALVAHGFAQDLVSHSSTNLEPAHLIDILRDQEAAIALVMDCIRDERPLTKGLIHELHAILMNHQSSGCVHKVVTGPAERLNVGGVVVRRVPVYVVGVEVLLGPACLALRAPQLAGRLV